MNILKKENNKRKSKLRLGLKQIEERKIRSKISEESELKATTHQKKIPSPMLFFQNILELEVADSPKILSCDEARNFWISWSNEGMKVSKPCHNGC